MSRKGPTHPNQQYGHSTLPYLPILPVSKVMEKVKSDCVGVSFFKYYKADILLGKDISFTHLKLPF